MRNKTLYSVILFLFDNLGGVEDCAETWWGTTWNDIKCDGKQPSICEMI